MSKYLCSAVQYKHFHDPSRLGTWGIFFSKVSNVNVRVYPFYHQQCGREGVALSTVSSVDVGGVFLYTISSVKVEGIVVNPE